MSLVHVTSLTPVERFLKKWSWTVGAGATRVRDEGCSGCLAATGEFGAGVALAPFGDAVHWWLFADAKLLVPVEGGLFDFARVGVGPKMGLRFRLHERLALLGAASLHYLPAQEPTYTWEGQGILRWFYARDFAVSAETRLQPDAVAIQGLSQIYF
jgi:hypothetical protein